MSLIRKIRGRINYHLRYNSSRTRLAEFLENAARNTADGSMVLDAGAGDCRYSEHFPHANYEAADICVLERNYEKVKYKCDLREMPVESERFDVVVCTQVLEHVPEPKEVLVELNRVLKPGGKLYLSAPLYYPEHEVPYDFFRYTQFGFRHLLDGANFEVEQLEWLEGCYMTMATQFFFASDALSLRSLRGRGMLAAPVVLLAKLVLPIFGAVFSRLDGVQKVTSSGHCKNYAIIATKKAS